MGELINVNIKDRNGNDGAWGLRFPLLLAVMWLDRHNIISQLIRQRAGVLLFF